ncbi:MAG: PKD domain-containing protein, partial [Methanosarcinales archaeon]|nr:PKD domain-containing protein [Methanosarcinales archaeon]
ITFDASASYDPYGNITYYQWDLGDGSYVNTTQRTVTHSYDEGGNYSVVLTVTDDEGEMDSITRVITIQQSAPLDERWDQTFGGAGDDRVHSLENTSEDGNVLTDGEPVRTPDIPGFGAAVAVMGLLVWVGLVGRRRQ